VLVDAIAAVKPEYVLVDRLRLKEGVWENVGGFIHELRPNWLRSMNGSFRVVGVL